MQTASLFLLFGSFEFITLNYNQHQLEQQKGFCSLQSQSHVDSCFHSVSFPSILFTPHGLYLQLRSFTFKYRVVYLLSNFTNWNVRNSSFNYYLTTYRFDMRSVQVIQEPIYFYKPTFIALNLQCKCKISPLVTRNSKTMPQKNKTNPPSPPKKQKQKKQKQNKNRLRRWHPSQDFWKQDNNIFYCFKFGWNSRN